MKIVCSRNFKFVSFLDGSWTYVYGVTDQFQIHNNLAWLEELEDRIFLIWLDSSDSLMIWTDGLGDHMFETMLNDHR